MRFFKNADRLDTETARLAGERRAAHRAGNEFAAADVLFEAVEKAGTDDERIVAPAWAVRAVLESWLSMASGTRRVGRTASPAKRFQQVALDRARFDAVNRLKGYTDRLTWGRGGTGWRAAMILDSTLGTPDAIRGGHQRVRRNPSRYYVPRFVIASPTDQSPDLGRMSDVLADALRKIDRLIDADHARRGSK
jgi:hypothetical protein